jgi:site-specific DNA-methyltransferase (adenine-specific)
LEFLETLSDASVDLVFADPPYNIGKATWDEFPSHDDYLEWSLMWIAQASRVLTKSGSLYVCGFPEVLADLKRPALVYFKRCRWISWYYKNKANLGKDWGRSHEAIIHYRKDKKTRINQDDVRIPYRGHTLKYPVHPQAESSQYTKGQHKWTPHPKGAKPRDVIEVPTISNGMPEKTPHPTQKPEELVRKFILASSDPGDTVLDPFSGSGTTLVCAQQLQRRWIGCDQSTEYSEWAIKRLEATPSYPIEKWIEIDRQAARKRS